MKMPPVTPYGVPLRQIMQSGDPDLMAAMARLSTHMMGMVKKAGGAVDDDWATAHKQLKKAAGG